MTVATWIAFLAYAGVAIYLGARDTGSATSDQEFWTAGRDLRWPGVGMSISAGFLSISWSCVYAVQLYYWYGLGAFWLMTVPWLLALGGIYWLSRRYHALEAFSQPEMVGRRFGRSPRRLVAIALAFVFLVWGGAEIYVAARLLAPGMGVSVASLILLIGLVVAVYSTLGGFRAVIDTDKLQYAIVTTYILAMAWLAGRGLATLPDGGTGGIGELLADPPEAALTGLPWTAALAPGAALIVLTLVAYLPGWLFETDLWLRVQAARDTRAARRGVGFAMLNSLVFIGIVPLFIGVAALAIFPPVGGVIPPELGNQGDAVFAALVERFAPPWLALLVVVGLVAAAMSTIDTCTNVMALSVGYDLLGRTRAAESRIVNLGAVAATCAFALGTESLWDIFYLSSGILTTAVALPVAGVMIPGLRPAAVTLSSGAGLVVTGGGYWLEGQGALAAIEPAAVAESGLGFILWGACAAVVGCAVGQMLPGPEEDADDSGSESNEPS